MYDTSDDDDYDFEAEHGLFINQYSPFSIYLFIYLSFNNEHEYTY